MYSNVRFQASGFHHAIIMGFCGLVESNKLCQKRPSELAILLALLLASNSSNLRQLVITHSSQATKLLYRVSECVSE
jgi:hypothetical protein